MANNYIPYININDYAPDIQNDQLLNQILDPSAAGVMQLQAKEKWAMATIKSKLSQRYDLYAEFTPTCPWDATKTYNANDRVIIDYPAWIASNPQTYLPGNCVIWTDNNGYVCLNANNDAVWTPANWTVIAPQYTIFYVTLPYQRFSLELGDQHGINIKGFYKLNDNVWWANHTYLCKLQTATLSHDFVLQCQRYGNIPYLNQFPNQPNNTQWTDLGAYTVPAGTLPTMKGWWTCGDNRESVIMGLMLDMVIYKLCERIAPQNIPENRVISYKMAWDTLAALKDGKENTELLPIQPLQGSTLRWNSNVKNRNTW